MTTRRPDAPQSMTTQHDDDAPPASGLSSMQRAIMTIQKMRAKIENLERVRVEPIAIIGMGCRFPGGANTPEAFFELLKQGVDAITEVPPERWGLDVDPSTDPEARAVRWGAFLRDVDLFDARFFSISPREASKMDPQQRLLLEVTWEALERAGQLPERLVGSRTGVFLGIMNNDYAELSAIAGIEQEDAYTTTGNGHCFPAGRISYTFGFQGPSMAVDTACSSSLVAIHLACQSLRSGECNMAVAGGVNLMLVPSTTRKYARTQALSPDGRCKTFDATANGFVRGEGCGMVVLKRLSDAERDGDTIVALIRGSAVNQDGRSTGLTTPNVLAQQAMLTQALESSRIAPSDIGYVETHGTGTSLGDPIEMEALTRVFGHPREAGSVCALGAVKTNIGHLESAAGVAGLIKSALVLQNGLIPKNIHFRTLNPRIQLDRTPFVIPTEPRPWRAALKRRVAGVSSFGMSGTNAHVVVEEFAQSAEEDLTPEASSYLLPLSAKSPEALRAHASAFRDYLTSTQDVSFRDVVHTASLRRSHFEYRISAVGRTREELARSLDAFLGGEVGGGLATGKSTPARAKVVFVFSGQGAQWLGMGRKLYEEESAFRSVIDSCDALLTPRLGWSLLDELDTTESMSRLNETQVAQPLIFSIQIALVELLRSWGVAPDAVIGHSVGEIAAAYIAGILSLDEAVRLVAIRGRIMNKATGLGKMVAVAANPDVARQAIAGYEDRLGIAAVNDPGSVVLSGQTVALDEVVAKLEREGVSCRPLRVNYAFHSPQMEPLATELVERLVRVTARRATLAMYSTILSECVEGKELDARYWGRNVQETVQFAGAVDAAIHDGYQLFLEVGPHPVLAANVEQCLAMRKAAGLVAFTLRRNQDERRSLLEATGALYTRGCAPEWARLAPSGGKCVPLPTYPWQRQRYWLELPEDAPFAAVGRKGKSDAPTTQSAQDDIIFGLAWRAAPAAVDANCASARVGTWMVLCDERGTGRALGAMMRARGIPCVLVEAGERYERVDATTYRIQLTSAEDHVELLKAVFDENTVCAGIVHLFALDAVPVERASVSTLEADGDRVVGSALFLVQALVQRAFREGPRLVFVTRGAQAVLGDVDVVSVAQAPLWGFRRTLALEHPDLDGKLVDLSPEVDPLDVERLCHELFVNDSESEVALRGELRHVARMTHSSFDAAPARGHAVHPESSYLITGGLGGLGLSVAQWLVAQGARHVALVGRRAPTPAAHEAIARLREVGANVVVLEADVSRAADVDAVLERVRAEARPLAGIVHAAGVVDDRTLLDLSRDKLARVFGPKMLGSWNLHERTRAEPLDFFVMYSSTASLLGSPGQANYAAANAFMDALAHARVAAGLPATSIHWGPFSDVGMAALRDNRGQRLSSRGLESLTPEEGARALGLILARPRAEVAVMRFSPRRWLDFYPQAAASPMFAELSRERGVDAAASEARRRLREELERVTPAERVEQLAAHVLGELGKVLRQEPRQLDPRAGFASLGMDSLMGVELRNRIEATLGIKLAATMLYTYTSPTALIDHLASQFAAPPKRAVEAPAAPPAPSPAAEPAKEGAGGEDDLLSAFDASLREIEEQKLR
ncbi:type I polyketide synthase [Polyangium sorediatum]|uniref:Type I polyketide synthase n=1 Tax=Polyangium sorediatum TaxID=889274 RepID=A0ABT6NUV3_9BACT|nr:type I polyketide synthase [Polyangium sorediatum]MDI1431900.1 type I polyketide synthase [Polyangium sorediatum]